MIPALRSPLARLLLLAAVGFLVLPGPVAAQHPAIYLMDVEGNVIDPINEENAEAPFSTMMTCGMCHEYDTITQGYHFQMGWDVIADDYGVEEGRPWSLSNGLLGRWYPYAFRQLAKKQNRSADEIDLTVYDFVGFSSPGRGQPPCGACHPGGGGLEFDREGNRYDEHLAEDPDLVDTLDEREDPLAVGEGGGHRGHRRRQVGHDDGPPEPAGRMRQHGFEYRAVPQMQVPVVRRSDFEDPGHSGRSGRSELRSRSSV